MGSAGRFDGLQANEATYAVFSVNDDGAFIEAGNFGDEIGIALAALRAAEHAVAENILLAYDDEAAGLEAAFQIEDGGGRLALGQHVDFLHRLDGLDALETM